MRNILLVNQSTLVEDCKLAAVTAALQKQICRHFGPVWGVDATVSAVTLPPDHPYAPAAECIVLLDNAEQAEALGYPTASGSPQGLVFVKDAVENWHEWSSVLSHELLEQLVNPAGSACSVVKLPDSFKEDAGKTAVVMHEVCDPVEGETYVIDGVAVANFVLPAWFSPSAATPCDFLGTVHAPLTVSGGGFVSYSVDLSAWKETGEEVQPLGITHGKSKWRKPTGANRHIHRLTQPLNITHGKSKWRKPTGANRRIHR